MLIWRGWGIVVVGVALLAIFFAAFVASFLNLSEDAASIVTFASFIPAGVATWYVGRRMNRNALRELVDPQTGETVQLRSYHDFFFLRVEWWCPIMAILGTFAVLVLIFIPPS